LERICFKIVREILRTEFKKSEGEPRRKPFNPGL